MHYQFHNVYVYLYTGIFIKFQASDALQGDQIEGHDTDRHDLPELGNGDPMKTLRYSIHDRFAKSYTWLHNSFPKVVLIVVIV